MLTRILLAAATVSLAVTVTGSPAARAIAETQSSDYPIPGHGVLTLEVPVHWQVTYYQPRENAAPIIIFYPLRGPQTFQLTTAVFWDDSPARNITAPEQIRKLVEQVGIEVLAQSDQDTLELSEFSGREGTGYLFDLSDKDAGAGEYRYLTQGALGVGEVLVVFSLFTMELDPELRDTVLTMLRGARLKRQRQDVRRPGNSLATSAPPGFVP